MDGHRFIENRDTEEKQALRKKTEEKLGFSLSGSPSVDKRADKVKRYFTAIATAVCAVCLLVAFPFILRQGINLENHGALNNGGAPNVGAYDYSRQAADCNIKEYNIKHGTSMLYIDLYDSAEEVSTYVYLSDRDKSALYFCETIFSQENFNKIDLYIVDAKADIESFNWREDIAESKNSAVLKGVSVHWFGTDISGTAVFRYKDYKYFIELCDGVDEADILGIVESMLNSDKTV